MTGGDQVPHRRASANRKAFVRSWPRVLLPTTLAWLAPLCGQAPDANNQRHEPSCAQMDCSTGTIIDNGCSADGRCLSCVYQCNTVPLEPK